MITDILNDIGIAISLILISILLILISIIVYEALTRWLSKFIRFFIILTALLLTAGGILALLAGMMKFNYDVINFWHTDIENFDEVFIKLIHLAEYLLIGITFFSIAARLTLEPYFKSENKADQARNPTDIPDLEKHIIGMVIATISVAFIGFVVSGNNADISLKIGIAIAAFITSLGLYLKFSSHKNDATLDILRQEIMQLRTKDNKSGQDETPAITELQDEN